MSTTGPWVNTISGRRFYLENPDVNDITAGDIAWGLSMICRFNGHVRDFYSVTQHCVIVSYNVPAEHALAGLLHDAAEAFIGDVSKPLKDVLGDGGRYRKLERKAEAAIARTFGITFPFDPSIKAADLRTVKTEIRDLCVSTDKDYWSPGTEPLDGRIEPLGPRGARTLWKARYKTLTGEDA